MNNVQQENAQQKKIIFSCQPGGCLTGVIRVPGDKSISHRSIMLGALAEGRTHITGFLEGEDAIATLNAFRAMGVKIEGPNDAELTVHGVGLHGLKAPVESIDLGNSGTAMRLMSGLLAGQQFNVTLTGDASLSKRPMKRVIEPLTKMGAVIDSKPDGTPPLTISGGQKLTGIDYVMPMASAQVKSSLLLAGLFAEGATCVAEPATTRDHTERMLKGFGYTVENYPLNSLSNPLSNSLPTKKGTKVCLLGGGKLKATNIDVPGDISSAAFFIVGACITNNSDVTLQHVGINPTRIGVVNILRLMGADISISNERDIGGEPVGDIRVRSSQLKGIIIPKDQVPLAIDEFPVIFIAAACAEGDTVLEGAEELRVKESDRIQVMADALSNVGVKARPTVDGMVISGSEIKGGEVDSCGDHRIAMAMSIAALRSQAPITIHDCANVNTSFPGFAKMANSLGHNIRVNVV
ncbi:MAG: 3-phosphoshikimate 1-carboxyvinyltransferase [Gammaproteobacteria bacterium]|nr:3-phosphoshikimate 1-carboxyvinyltransferase [Gammaproteobacteria bacterium]